MASTRTRQARPTGREKLMEAAFDLMLGKGYPATTVDEICAAAGVSKGSFYHFFSSKEELGLATLKAFNNQGVAEILAGPHTGIEDPLERLLAFIDHFESISERLWSRGCMLGTFATELGQTHPEIRKEVSRLFRDVTEKMARVFEPVCRSRLPEGPTATELAEQMLESLEGAIILARAYAEPGRIPHSIRTFRRYVELLVGQ